MRPIPLGTEPSRWQGGRRPGRRALGIGPCSLALALLRTVLDVLDVRDIRWQCRATEPASGVIPIHIRLRSEQHMSLDRSGLHQRNERT